jgi:hypothetical protein
MDMEMHLAFVPERLQLRRDAFTVLPLRLPCISKPCLSSYPGLGLRA